MDRYLHAFRFNKATVSCILVSDQPPSSVLLTSSIKSLLLMLAII